MTFTLVQKWFRTPREASSTRIHCSDFESLSVSEGRPRVLTHPPGRVVEVDPDGGVRVDGAHHLLVVERAARQDVGHDVQREQVAPLLRHVHRLRRHDHDVRVEILRQRGDACSRGKGSNARSQHTHAHTHAHTHTHTHTHVQVEQRAQNRMCNLILFVLASWRSDVGIAHLGWVILLEFLVGRSEDGVVGLTEHLLEPDALQHLGELGRPDLLHRPCHFLQIQH